MQPENAIEVRDLTKKFKVFYDKGISSRKKSFFTTETVTRTAGC